MNSQAAPIGWHLGMTSALHESRGTPGTISPERGDHGGVSYGTYQLSTKMGTLDEYLRQSAYKRDFEGLTPTTPAFDEKWRELADSDPGFGQDQHKFIKRTHYDVQVAALQHDGLDLTNRGPAVQDALWSTSVQTRGLTVRIFEDGLKEKFGHGYKLASLSDKDIVGAIQDYKIAHNETLFKLSETQWPGLLKRAHEEKTDLLALVDGHVPAHLLNQEAHHTSSVKIGSHGQEVNQLQTELSALDYTDAKGQALQADGQFGHTTKAAVESFQHDHGLKPDGIAGHETRQLLQATVQKSQEATALLRNTPAAPEPLCPFSDPSHPQNAMYRTLKDILPPGTSEERLVQGTAACHMAGISPDDLSGVYVGDKSVLFTSSSFLAVPAQMDISQPAPQVQQTMQQVQQYDQQQAQIQTQIHAQNAQVTQQVPQGPVMGGPMH